jgi:exodeoxyribonuclease VII small subunit
MSGEKARSFEENIARLEEIVSMLERGTAKLADSLALFEEGTKLVGVCTAMLGEAAQKVVVLQKGPDGEPVETPFGVEE